MMIWNRYGIAFYQVVRNIKMINKNDLTRQNKWNDDQVRLYNQLEDDLTKISGLKWISEYNADYDRFTCKLSGSVVQASPKNYQGHYSFFSWASYPYVSNYDKYDGEKPNNVGVLSRRKINEWIAYVEAKDQYLKDLSYQRQAKISQFLADLKSAGIPYREVLNWDKKPTGAYNADYVKNGIRYRVEIDSRSGHISKKIEAHYSVNATIDNFLKLSDNSYE